MSFLDTKKDISELICSSYLVELEGFRQCDKELAWYRISGDIVYLFYMEKMASDNIRLRAFIFSAVDRKVNIGGNVTRASVQGSDDYGADWYWCITDKNELEESLNDIQLVISRVVLPWFSLVDSLESLNNIRNLYPNSSVYDVSVDFNIDIDNIFEVANRSFPLDKSGFRSFLDENLDEFFSKNGFERIDGERVSYVRKRGEIFDVFILDLINYGLAFGVYAFNWVSQMSLDGSGNYSEDFAFLLNGGTLSDSGQLGVDSGVGFSFEVNNDKSLTHKNLKELLSSKVMAELETINDVDSFKASIKNDMLPIARRFGLT